MRRAVHHSPVSVAAPSKSRTASPPLPPLPPTYTSADSAVPGARERSRWADGTLALCFPPFSPPPQPRGAAMRTQRAQQASRAQRCCRM
eukprot:7113331-Prymnesium_polylepis.1